MMREGARALVTGGTGLLGRALLDTAPAGWDVWATWHQHPLPAERSTRSVAVDVQDEPAVARLVDALRPEVVLHTASVGSVDDAQRDTAAVRQVNVGGTQAIGRACLRIGARLVLLSSNAVFDGRHPPYTEDAAVCAANRYGALKIEAEAWVRDSGVSAVIIRPILMYGWPSPGGRENAVTRWLSRLEHGLTVDVADDIFSMPLFADNCAEAVWAAVLQRREGIYHVAGADRLSLVEFAQETARVFQCDERLVRAVPSAQFTQLAPRPRDTSFVIHKMQQELGVRPVSVREGLSMMLRTRPVAQPQPA